jgi:hypothetical protein
MPTFISSPLQTFSLVSCPSRARAPVVVLCEWLARGRSAMPLREGAGRCERRWPRRRRRRRWVGRLRPSAAQASIIVRPGAARWERTQLTRSLPPSQPVGQREALARADTSKAASKADQSRGRQRTRGGRRRGGCLPNMQRPPALTGQRSMSRVELVPWPTMCSKGQLARCYGLATHVCQGERLRRAVRRRRLRRPIFAMRQPQFRLVRGGSECHPDESERVSGRVSRKPAPPSVRDRSAKQVPPRACSWNEGTFEIE